MSPAPSSKPSASAAPLEAAGIAPARASYAAVVERTVAALHYELVDVERSAGGLLRVTIDRLPGQAYATGESDVITIDDCETVTRQLQYVLEVDDVSYTRLEVSSPGLDRPLRKPEDFKRFVGEAAEVTLKAPWQGRKRFRGVLATREAGEQGLRLLLDDTVGQAVDTRVKRGKAVVKDTVDALDFEFNEVRDARLVPIVNFKGRAARGSVKTEPAAEELNGGLDP